MCFLCKSNEHDEFIRSFVYDLIVAGKHTMPLLFQNLVLQCVRIWPDPFSWPCNDLDEQQLNPVLCAIIFVVRDSIVKNNAKIDAQSSTGSAHSSSNSIVNYSEYSAYYIYVRHQYLSMFITTNSTFSCFFLDSKILEKLCFWESSYTSSDQLCLQMGDNLAIDGPLISSNHLFIMTGLKSSKISDVSPQWNFYS